MNAEMIMGLVIISIVAVIMVIIGISQFNKKENPVGFYNVIAPPKKEEISDVIQWNKKHGFIWIVYGICIELGFWLGYIMPSEVLEMVFMMGGVIIPLPFMVLRHRALEKEYKLNLNSDFMNFKRCTGYKLAHLFSLTISVFTRRAEIYFFE